MFLCVILRNNFVEILVLDDHVAVRCLVIDFIDDMTYFYSSQMFFFVWYAVYRLCVCVCGVQYILCVRCAVYVVRACGVQYMLCAV